MHTVSATRPFMVVNGNHERFYNYSAYRNRFKMPYQASAGNGGVSGSPDGFWYTHSYGNVNWIAISSEHSLDDGRCSLLIYL